MSRRTVIKIGPGIGAYVVLAIPKVMVPLKWQNPDQCLEVTMDKGVMKVVETHRQSLSGMIEDLPFDEVPSTVGKLRE